VAGPDTPTEGVARSGDERYGDVDAHGSSLWAEGARDKPGRGDMELLLIIPNNPVYRAEVRVLYPSAVIAIATKQSGEECT
jgi:hypothetical protein